MPEERWWESSPIVKPADEGMSPTQILARAREKGAENVPGWALPAALAVVATPAIVGEWAALSPGFRSLISSMLKYEVASRGTKAGLKQVGVPADIASTAGTIAGVATGGPAMVHGVRGLLASRGAGVAAAATEAAPAVAKAAAPAVEAVAAPAAEVAAPAVEAAAPAMASRSALAEFARETLQRTLKWGEKIWLELNEAGQPVKVLTSDQAGAAARAGRPTTWFKNGPVTGASTPTAVAEEAAPAVASARPPVAADSYVAQESAQLPESYVLKGQRVSSMTPEAVRAATKPGAATESYQKVLKFVAAATKSSKHGEKIWVELDAAGEPVRVLTPGQAGAAARAGRPTTWVRNIWSRGSALAEE